MNRQFRFPSLVLFLGVIGSITVGTAQNPVNDITLPEPYATPHARNSPRVIDRPEDASLALPEGFKIEVWAEDFERPRYMLLGPGNEIILSDSANEGKVWVLQDKDHDGTAETRHELISGMYRPYGIAFWKDYIYIAGTVEVKRWKYDAQTMTVAGDGEVVVSWPEFEKGHWTRSIVFDSAGEKMYVSVGSASNVDAGEDPKRAAINVYNPYGSGHEIFAEGLRNVIGMDFYPGTDQLWAAVQERDALGDELVPDYFTTVNRGEFFGWPYAYIGPNEDPRREGERPDLVEKTRKPEFLIQSHSAVLDVEFYTHTAFPEKYHGGVFLAYHGSWNRAERTGYSVTFVPFKDGRPTAGPENFLTGWMLSPSEKEVWGRPVGILQLPDGSLLVSDDGGRKIWRIWYAGS
ncbi:MAG: PQQ-dependent sugar dehydrogenase [Acidobacteriota bacterium]|nr:MAG: PQQ-dependent sugar dehydrogenase [Acidobacteriota bacterium]